MSSDFAIYVHWPFCARICPYCDFNVHKDRGPDAARWAAALTREIDHWAAQTQGRRVTSLYFGGGTPSLAPLSVIEAVIAAAARRWPLAADAEITLEANPNDVLRFRDFRAAGVNRLSLGVQSFSDVSLKFLGRDHTGADAQSAIGEALALFPRVSADLIYALPGQTIDQWTEELGKALLAGLNHLSLYQLTIEPGTAFDLQVAKGRWAPADDSLAADLFDAAQAITAAAGVPAYEISNHATPGHRSRHNSAYWSGADYIGIGPGAHGRVTIGGARCATETARAPENYLQRLEGDGNAVTLNAALTAEQCRIEKFAMGLRTVDGIDADANDLAALGRVIDTLVADGFLRRTEARITATEDGRRLLNAVLERLFA